MQGETILLIGVGLLATATILFFIIGCKKKKPIDKFDKIPFVFKMHGKRFTPEEAFDYYEILQLRGLEDVYIEIYDTTLKEIVFKGNFSYYQKEYVTLKDNLYHE